MRVEPDKRFRRDGDDLRTSVDVPLAVAIAGGEVVRCRPWRASGSVSASPGETQNGKVLRLRGLGMPRLKGSGHGDLFAEVAVRLRFPTPAALRQWAEAEVSPPAAPSGD